MRNTLKSNSAIAALIMAMAIGAYAAPPGQPEPQAKPPKTPKPPANATYWVGDTAQKGTAYLGVDVADITKERVSTLKLKDEHGVEITMVDQDAPAGKAGLKEHDVILDFNGSRVEGEEQLRRMIHETPAGRTVTLGISRDGQTMNIPATLGSHGKTMMIWGNGVAPRAIPMPTMPVMPAMPAIPEFDMPDVNVMVRSYSVTAGMMVDNLTPQLGEFFGVKSGQGVLVRSVEKGSAAESAGLKAGDVIVRVGDEKIGDRSDWRRALRDRKSAKVPLGVIREKKEQTLTITLSEPKTKDSSRLKGHIFRRDNNDDVIEEDDDFDGDFEIDGWEGAAALLNQNAKNVAFLAANQSLLTAQQAFKALQPQIEQEMKKSQQRIQEEMKRMEEKLRSLQQQD